MRSTRRATRRRCWCRACTPLRERCRRRRRGRWRCRPPRHTPRSGAAARSSPTVARPSGGPRGPRRPPCSRRHRGRPCRPARRQPRRAARRLKRRMARRRRTHRRIRTSTPSRSASSSDRRSCRLERPPNSADVEVRCQPRTKVSGDVSQPEQSDAGVAVSLICIATVAAVRGRNRRSHVCTTAGAELCIAPATRVDCYSSLLRYYRSSTRRGRPH